MRVVVRCGEVIQAGGKVCEVWCVDEMFFFLMVRRPPRSTQSRSSAASDVYKRQLL